jgi:hypothetical protein
MQQICDGLQTKRDVLHFMIEQYKEVYMKARREFQTVENVSSVSPFAGEKLTKRLYWIIFMAMEKLRRLYEQPVEEEGGEQRGVLAGVEERPGVDVVVITRITITTITTTTTTMMMTEADLLVVAVGVLLGEEVVGLVREEPGVEEVVREILLQPETGGLAMVRLSL